MRRALIALVIVGLVLGLAAPAGAKTKTHTLDGTIDLRDAGGWSASQAFCEGSGGYSDIAGGGKVTVRSGGGKILALGQIKTGQPGSSTAGGYYVVCHLTFKVKKVPDAKFYSVEIGNRDPLNYSLADMKKNHWFLGLSIGP